MPLSPQAHSATPRSWGRSLSAPPLLSNACGTRRGVLMRHWRGVAPDIAQPALDHHYLTMHMGGAKRVERRGEGSVEAVDVDPGALSIVPAGAAFHWNTRGPVEFAHLYLAPQTVRDVSEQELGRDITACGLEERLGVRDPLLEALFLTMLEESAHSPAGSQLYLDTLLHSIVLRLLRRYGAPSAPLVARHSLAPARLRRVLEFVEANLSADIALADLAAVAATSPFHFNRAFASAIGTPPYAYLVRRRIEHAKTLLVSRSGPLKPIAIECGFHSVGQFSRMFKRTAGRTPLQFRQERRCELPIKTPKTWIR